MFGITGAITAISNMLAELFGWRTAEVERQLESEVVEDKRDLEKACGFAELALSRAEKYRHLFGKLDRHSFEKNLRKFRGYR